MLWSRNLGSSDVSPSFADTTRQNLFVGTNSGQVYRLQASDGQSCWRSDQSGCGSSTGTEVAFCTNTDTLSESCAGDYPLTSGFFTVWSGVQAGNVVFVAADGHLRMIDKDGALVWKTQSSIAGASFPLILPSSGKLYVGAADGKLHELSLTDGTETATQTVGDSSATVGSPTYDVYAGQLYVGSADGRLYQFDLPF